MGPAGSEMRLPYHGSGKSASSDNSKDSEEEYQEISKSGRDNLKAAAAAQGIMFPPYGRNARDGGAEAYFRQAAAGRGDGADGSAAAFHSAAAEERARRLMLAAAGAPGGAAAYLNPHFGLGGLGGLGGAGPSLHHFQGGNVAHLHAMSSAASHLLSPHALMLAGLSPQQQSSAAALLQASRSRELASQFGGGGGSSINPYLLSHHQQGQSQPPQLHDTSRLHEFVGSNGNKRPRKDPECDIPEEKAARLSRQYL